MINERASDKEGTFPMSLWCKRFQRGVFAASLLVGCGPMSLAENVEHAGPIGGPFAVSRFFTASGYMGDGVLPGFLLGEVDENCQPRPVGAAGNCYRFIYNVGDAKWAGVFWQHPANNWGALPGRTVVTRFSHVRFSAAAEYSIVLPPGGKIGQSCAETSDCRNGLSCEGNACAPAGTTALAAACLVSAECEGAAQCIGQLCQEAGASPAGGGCGSGDDRLCADGLLCGVVDNVFQCVAEGPGDVGEPCRAANDCRSGLYCSRGECRPKTLLRQILFKVGGLNFPPVREDLKYSDEIDVPYFPAPGEPNSLIPELQRFRLDLSIAPEFTTLLGAFMWAAPFPDIDIVIAEGPQPYLADPSEPVLLYFDDIFFETE